jgi:predicted nuclease of predicted toxin-antitoxin system
VRFFLDENFPRAAAEELTAAGHACSRTLEHFPPGSPDDDLFAKAQELGAIFVTTDRDFFHTIPWLHERHAGVIAITLAQPNRAALLARLRDAVRLLEGREAFHQVWLLTDDRLFER